MKAIPNPVAVVVGQALGSFYFHHQTLEAMFMAAGAPGNVPEGNCVKKCVTWLKRANAEHPAPFQLLGKVLEEFMEVEPAPFKRADWDEAKAKVEKILAAHGLRYVQGGHVAGAVGTLPTKSLADILRARDEKALELEFQRAMDSVQTDPPAAATAACSIIETACTVYLEDNGLELPKERSVLPLWKAVQRELGLSPADVEDEDLRAVLGGLSALVHGIGGFRTHAGSAHGKGRKAYRVRPRHARLVVGAAHTFVTFLLETWAERQTAAPRKAAAS